MLQFSPESKNYLKLFTISFLMLFFEILMIRWLSAEIRIFSYFHNLVLLFCFFGIGLGCLISHKKIYFIVSFILMIVLAGLLSLGDHLGALSLQNISKYLSVYSDFLIWDNAQRTGWYRDLLLFMFGTALLLVCMCVLAAFFIPFGQLLGRLLNENDRPLNAYGMNLLGSIFGILLFYLISKGSLPPSVWFAVGGICCLPFVLPDKRQFAVALCLLMVCVFLVKEKQSPDHWTVWSPYQKLTVWPMDVQVKNKRVRYGNVIFVNSVGYMLIINYSPDFTRSYPGLFPPEKVPYDHYNIPYRFTQYHKDVLVVGSGTGNDVAAALRNGAEQVSAVEIDPEIIRIGSQLHPEKPYGDQRVEVINDDARAFFKTATKKYDLIIFGLLDSHTLSSSYSNVRLDNYVYTLNSFMEAKRLLKPTGILVMIFEVRDEFIGARFSKMLSITFRKPPIGFHIRFGFRNTGGYGFVTGNFNAIQESVNRDQELKRIVSVSEPIFRRWSLLNAGETTDDWPYLYLQQRSIPKLYLVIFGLLGLFFYAGIKKVDAAARRLNWHFLFLGAGFLLLEVQNISRSALLFGSTWVVNTVVISAVLVTVLVANYVSLKWRVTSMTGLYLALLLSLAVNFVIPLEIFSSLPAITRGLLSGAFMSLPILFAGIIFSTSFAGAADRSGAFASNLFGAMIGGMAECLSFLVGVKALLIVAASFYLLSLITRNVVTRPMKLGAV